MFPVHAPFVKTRVKYLPVPFFLIIRRIVKPIGFLTLLLLIGSAGYHYIEGYSFVDAVYMTTITISTVGFGEVHPLSYAGKIFTLSVILGGVIFYGLAINSMIKIILETSFRELLEQSIMEKKLKSLKEHFIICGGGRFAYALAQEFEKAGKEFVIIENNLESIVAQNNSTWLLLNADAMQEETLVQAGIMNAKGLASVLPTDADNLFVVLSARRLNPAIRIETRVSMESTRPKMLQAGADKVISPYTAGGRQMARSILEPDIAEFVEVVMERGDLGLELKVHNITEEDDYAGKKLIESDFRQRGYIVIAIKKKGAKLMFAPSASEELNPGDQIYLLGANRDKMESAAE